MIIKNKNAFEHYLNRTHQNKSFQTISKALRYVAYGKYSREELDEKLLQFHQKAKLGTFIRQEDPILFDFFYKDWEPK